MIKEIVKDEEFLQQVAEPATAEDAEVAQDLVDTMKSMSNCACLAANQIGVNKAIIAYESSGRPCVMYNPVVKEAIIPYKATESCLSLGRETEVTRFRRIIVEYQELVDGALVNRRRKLTDWAAEVVQHAVDHCKGKLV